MSAQTVQEMLQDEIKSLPEPLVEEVFDFVLFMKARHAEEAFLWKQVKEAQDYRSQHPEEVITATPEEWEESTQHLDAA